ncbi:NACHT and WD repeat domain-containing protein [Actinoplanes sp. NPDC051411]|uniref:NACHT and WD repeat domain-containing protein n=1 Tax=Actinoplanes sp. NPDC051411 TaxID=3155522 RepID=UPI003430EFD2
MGDLSGRGVRVLLIGTDTHDSPDLESVAAVGRTFEALRDRLLHRCGVPAAQLRTLRNPPTALSIAQAVSEEAGRAETVLLIYYVGHGLWSGGEVYLAARGTGKLTPGLAGHQAYAMSQLREALSGCPASSVVVVLDCCFSGRAQLEPPAPRPVFTLPTVHGAYLLGSAEQLALADPEQEYTAFSGELIELLDRGDPDAGPALTLDDAYFYLFETLRARNAPWPQRLEAGGAGRLAIAPNAAFAVNRTGDAAAVPPAAGPSPYRDLQPFREDDAELFYGRETLTAQLLATAGYRVADPRPVLVLGPSGSGKSSLLRAGLLAAAQRDGLEAPDRRIWPRTLPVLIPGGHPVQALGALIAPGEPGAARRLLDAPEVAAQLVDGLPAGDPGRPALLVIDQLEELFTLGADEHEPERAAFVRAIAAVAAPRADGTPRAIVVAALRADFYGRALEHPELAELFSGPQVVVTAMRSDDLRRAIEEPARRSGLTLGDGLVELLLHELGAYRPQGPEPGSLPLLSHVLWETWDRREGRTLTVRGYRDSGGLGGAVAQTADATYDALDEPGREAARRMLLRLVRVGDDTADTARSHTHEGLLDGLDPATAERALRGLVAARLVTVDEDVVRISHEALLQLWPRLRRWIDDDRAVLVAQRQLAEAARTWAREGRHRPDLYGGPRLAGARQTFTGHRRETLTVVEQEFLEASIRAAWRRRLQAVLAAVLVVLLGVAGVFAWRQHEHAGQLTADRNSRLIAAKADALRPTDPAVALQLNLTAYRTAPIPEARTGLYRAFATIYPRSVTGHQKAVVNLAYSADGRTLVSSGNDHTIRLWDVTTANPVTRAVLTRPGTTAIAVSPDGRLLAGYSANALTLWDIGDASHPLELSTVDAAPGLRLSVAFRPDGRVLATGGLEADGVHGTVGLWDVSDPRRPAPLAVDHRGATSVSFSRDGHGLATAAPGATWGTSKVRLFDVADTRRPAVQSVLTVNTADVVAFSPAANVLAAGGVGGEVNVWDVTDPRRPVAKINDHVSIPDLDGNITSLTFRPDGRMFATSSSLGDVDIWDINDQVNVYTSLAKTAPNTTVAFRPDGLGLANGAADGTLRVWSTAAPLLAGRIGDLSGNSPGSAYDEDGRLLLTDDSDAGARLWDVSDRARPALAARLSPQWPVATFLPGGRTVLSEDRTGTSLRLWDATDPRHPAAAATVTRAGPGGGELTVAAAPDGRHLAVGNTAQKTVRLLDIHDPRHPVPESTITVDDAGSVLWFMDTHLLATVDGTNLRLWDLTDPARPARAGTLDRAAGASALYVPSRHIAVADQIDSGGGQPSVRLWDVSDPRAPKAGGTIPVKAGGTDLALPDTHTLAVIADSGRIVLYDISDPGHPKIGYAPTTDLIANRMTTTPDHRVLISSSASIFGETMDLWRRADPAHDTFDSFATIAGEFPEPSPDSSTVAADATGSGQLGAFASNAVILWDLDPDRLYRQMCGTAPNVLGKDAWRSYFPAEVAYRAPCR